MTDYPHARKRHKMMLASLIGEQVDVLLETVDYNTTLISIAVANNPSAREGNKGVAVALRNHEVELLRDALSDMLIKGNIA